MGRSHHHCHAIEGNVLPVPTELFIGLVQSTKFSSRPCHYPGLPACHHCWGIVACHFSPPGLFHHPRTRPVQVSNPRPGVSSPSLGIRPGVWELSQARSNVPAKSACRSSKNGRHCHHHHQHHATNSHPPTTPPTTGHHHHQVCLNNWELGKHRKTLKTKPPKRQHNGWSLK